MILSFNSLHNCVASGIGGLTTGFGL